MKLVYRKFEQKRRVVVIDNISGRYLPIAQFLTKYFDVSYHQVVQNPFPTLSSCSVGLGYDVHILKDLWSNIDEFELFIFPDIYFKDWGNHLRKMGKLVWGACPSEDLETDRKLFKTELVNNGMEIAPTKYVIGTKALAQELKASSDKWIKISFYRGNMETFHHINWRQSEIWLNDLEGSLGPLGDTLQFMIEDSIESVAEIGGDGYTINGRHPNNFIYGIEVKDCGYIGKACPFSEMPQPIIDIYNGFGPVLNKYNHTGFYSSEIRVANDGKDYYTDPCMRAGSPPNSTVMMMIDNWDEILMKGAAGELVEPKFNSKYGVEIIIKSSECEKHFLPISFNSIFKDNIKLKGSLIFDNKSYIVPFDGVGTEFGSIVVVGDDVETIMNKAMEIASEIDCYGLIYDENALNKAKESLLRIEEALKVKF